MLCSFQFLPTPSARRATNDGRQQRHHRRISTHALREEGDAPAAGVAALIVISTHALREEGDLYQYPTPDLTDISTHALREEGDPAGSSRSSHKARFLPTPSARRATDFFNVFTAVFVISTHALREEGDGEKGRAGSTIRISTHALREEGDSKCAIK